MRKHWTEKWGLRIDGDEELFKDDSTCIQNRDSVTDWTSDNIKLESDSELNLLWDDDE